MENSISRQNVDVNVRAVASDPNVTVHYKTKVLQKNVVGGVNTLTTAMISEANVKYVIKYDYVLGEDITVPSNCILEFDGGSISASDSNDTITGVNTSIKAGLIKIFNIDVALAGTWNIVEIYSEWFGAIGGNSNIDSTTAIQSALNFAKNTNVKIVRLLDVTYYTSNSLKIYSYCSLLGTKQVATWHSCTQISSTSEIAIKLCATSDGICRITVENITLWGTAGSEKAISIEGDGEYGISEIKIRNVFALYFYYGIYITNNNFKGINGCEIEKCRLERNTIGIYIDGKVSTDTYQDMAWINYNVIRDCVIAHNSIGGIAIVNGKNILNNVIDNCCIESNGENYTLEDYGNHGCFGVKIYNEAAQNTDNNVISNTYIEHNIPFKTTGTATAEEYTYDGIIYPNNWYNNKLCGTLVVNQARCSIVNSFISRYYRIVSAMNNCHVSLINVSFNYTSKYFESETTAPVFTASCKWVRNVFVLNCCKFVSSQYKSIIENISGEYEQNIYNNTSITIIGTDNDIAIDNGKITSGNYVLGNSGKGNLGVSIENCFNSFANLINIVKDKEIKDLEVKLVGDTSSVEWGNSDNWRYSAITKIHIYGESTTKPKFTLGSTGAPLYISNDIVFENIELVLVNNSTTSSQYYIDHYGINFVPVKVTFKNCKITLEDAGGGGALFISNVLDNRFSVEFIGCTFNSSDNRPLRVFINNSINKLKEIYCIKSSDPSFTIIPNITANIKGTTVQRPSYVYPIGFEYFDTTLNKPVYAKEVDYTTGNVTWVDATGTTV